MRIFEAYQSRIAVPLQMEDFHVTAVDYRHGPESVHPGYPLRMSARDLARFRLRYLRKETRSFWAWGSRGHYVVIVPAPEAVGVHRVNRDVPGQEVSHTEFGRLLRLILDARE